LLGEGMNFCATSKKNMGIIYPPSGDRISNGNGNLYESRDEFSTAPAHSRLDDISTATTASDINVSTDTGAEKIVPFLLADIGEGISEVELLQWFVSPGDPISQFDKVCEVQSDKATVEITSRFDGVVHSLNGHDVGGMIKVGSPLIHIETMVVNENNATTEKDGSAAAVGKRGVVEPLHSFSDGDNKLSIPTVSIDFPDYHVANGDDNYRGSDDVFDEMKEEKKGRKVLTSPAVRKIAKENDIDLSTVVSTGPHGRILKADLLKLLGKVGSVSATDVGEVDIRTSEKTETPGPSSPTATAAVEEEEDTIVSIRGYSRVMFKHMTASLQVPHMCYGDEVDVTNLKRTRAELKPLAEAQNMKLTYMPFMIKAASLAMNEYPIINSSLKDDDTSLILHKNHNIGVAMDSPRGLAVAVIHNCQTLSILDITQELNRLQEAAMNGTLSSLDVSGATMSLSNIGSVGGTYMSPVIAPPQVSIGAVGKIQRLPRFVGDSDEVVAVDIMNVSWAGDHRVIDGAMLARFSNTWKAYLQNPATMMLCMK